MLCMYPKKPIISLMGPTASGKTDLAIALIQHFPVEIISVDSAMVYRGMNIGTAKPTPEALKKAPHHLIDLCDPVMPYSAGHFRTDALALIEEIIARNKIPLLVGGTMLYFHVLQNGVASLPIADPLIRETLTQEADAIGWPQMHEKLKQIDPEMSAQLHPNDSQRIQRALEVYKITGKTMTELQATQIAEALPYRFITIALEPKNRKHLHYRIEQRFQSMMATGFLEEVKQLKLREDLHPKLPSIRTVGYRQAWSYLSGEYAIKTMQDRAVFATRQLAKRQLTWLRRWKNVSRFYFEDQHLQNQVIRYLQKELSIEYRH